VISLWVEDVISALPCLAIRADIIIGCKYAKSYVEERGKKREKSEWLACLQLRQADGPLLMGTNGGKSCTQLAAGAEAGAWRALLAGQLAEL